jgi:hypothetical protein
MRHGLFYSTLWIRRIDPDPNDPRVPVRRSSSLTARG